MLFNLFNLSTNHFSYPFTKQHFILYKQVTSQYHDPEILHYVNLLVPEKIKKDIEIQLKKADISRGVNFDNSSNSNNNIHHNIYNDLIDRKDVQNVKDDSSFISMSSSFLNSLKELMIWFKKDFMR
jgi:hypothetical protein